MDTNTTPNKSWTNVALFWLESILILNVVMSPGGPIKRSGSLSAGCQIVSQDVSDSESLTSPWGQMFCRSTRVYQLQMPPFFSALSMSGCTSKHRNDFFALALGGKISNSFRALRLWWRSRGCLLLCYCCSQKIFIKHTAPEQQREMFSGVNLVSLLISFPPLFHLFLLPASQHLQTRLRGGEGGEKKLRITRPVQTRYQHVSRVIRLQVYNCKYRWEHPQDTRKMHLRSHPSCVHVRCDCLRNRHPLWTKNKTTGRIYYTLSDLHVNHRNVITTCLASPNLPVFSADVCEYAVSTDPATELVNHTILRSP